MPGVCNCSTSLISIQTFHYSGASTHLINRSINKVFNGLDETAEHQIVPWRSGLDDPWIMIVRVTFRGSI
jgi:hypothetical protein